MKRVYRWGIIGAGRIANKFADGLKLLPNAELYAVASRSFDRAEDFRARHGFAKAFGSYAEMLADKDLDAVYIATTNNLHYEHTMLCLEAGKAVLCEKPFASNREQVEKMINFSREKGVFLMEALWSRFVPSMLCFKEEAEKGRIGKPLLLQCDFGFVSPFDPLNRVYNPELGGGSIPDIGIYPVFTAMFLFGYPAEIKVISVPAPTGTDWTTAVIMKHKGKEISMLSSSFETVMDNEARLFGENGQLKLHRGFHVPTRLSFRANDGYETDIQVDQIGNGYNYEAAEVMDCLDRGEIESSRMSLSFSLELITVLDEIVRKAAEDF